MRRNPVALLAVASLVLLVACSTVGTGATGTTATPSAAGDDDPRLQARARARAREVLVVDRNDVGLLVGDEVVDAHVPRARTIGPLPEWAEASDVTLGDYDGVAIEILHDGPLELEERLATTHRLLAAAAGHDVDVHVVYGPMDGGWRLVLRSTDRPPPVPPTAAPALGPDPREVYRSAVLRLSIDLPGRVVAHNATATDGDLLAWDLPLAAGRAELFAISAPVAATSLAEPGALVVWSTVAAALGGFVVFGFVARRRRRLDRAGHDPNATPAPAPAPAPAITPADRRHWPDRPPPTPPGPRRPPGPP